MPSRNSPPKSTVKNKDVSILDIKKKIAYLKKKYDTSSPFVIASELGIKIIFEDLGSINGYYNKMLRMKQIHINRNLPEHMKKFTCAHELGHALLHPNANTPFLKNNTLLSVDKFETEANKFAMELLISDDSLSEYSECTIEQLSRIYGYHQKLIELRLK